ncbi:NUDIX hydrolase [Hyphomicrobium sp.]|uniref:NUDIX hydrolase n=1 Tax=Hyphomicrobium sp. TaxID=82 RepID=UPI002D7A29A7|nr:NUDIX hydrolase [Hyphomicrobium sp.]HET6390983.1 NUDIX hydrolase [Hyphomicrobium sp.]
MNTRPTHDAASPFADGTKAFASCTLKLSGEPWAFARDHASAIDAHWQAAAGANPAYFNGAVHLIDHLHASGGAIAATLTRTDFKSYLYWRTRGFPAAGVLDSFGSAVIRSSDGDVLLARQMPGNVNHGFACLPSGFIDARDVQAGGAIDIASSVAREVAEELGEDIAGQLKREDGFIVARSGTQLCFAVVYHASLSTAEIQALLHAHNAETEEPELEALIPVASLGDIAGLQMVPYARVLLEGLFAAR